MIEKQRKGKAPKLLKKDDVVFNMHGKKVVVSTDSHQQIIWPLEALRIFQLINISFLDWEEVSLLHW
jgi:hypothetical protein